MNAANRATAPAVFVSTAPFGESDDTPLRLLREAGVELRSNPHGRRLTEQELADNLGDATVLIAGTEPVTAAVMDRAPSLRLISRVGIGLDSVDLHAARARGIAVAYTPDAPSTAVSELTIGLIVSTLRGIGPADRGLREGKWRRQFGRRIATSTIGVFGVGRIGSLLVGQLCNGFPGVRVLANDIRPDAALPEAARFVDKDTVLRDADVVTLHLPLTSSTRGFIGAAELSLMKQGAVLVNTARGGIVDETALARALENGHLRAAAVDVFQEEPYEGPLTRCEGALLTCHMGSMTADCRARMETEAVRNALCMLAGEPLPGAVPEDEYQ